MKVLVIDDDTDARTMVRHLLESEGVETEEAESATLAAPLLKEKTYDVVLLDLQMPGVSWMDAVRTVRSLAPDSAVVVLSAHADWDVFFDAVKEGARDVVMKPFRAAELLRVIRHATETAAG